MSALHYVYRQYDAADTLLYIGCTRDPDKRDKQHRLGSPWGNEIDRYTVESFPNKESAIQEEAAAIRSERPRYNVSHSVIPRWYKEERDDDEATVSYRYDETVSLREAADNLGLSPSTVRAQIRRGVIRAGFLGFMLFVPKQEVERYRRENQGRFGRKPKAQP